MCAGHEALIIEAAVVSSDAERGARGCAATPLASRGVSVATVSVDISKA